MYLNYIKFANTKCIKEKKLKTFKKKIKEKKKEKKKNKINIFFKRFQLFCLNTCSISKFYVIYIHLASVILT